MKNLTIGFVMGVLVVSLCFGCSYTVSLNLEDRARFDKGMALLTEAHKTFNHIEAELNTINTNANNIENELNSINKNATNLEQRVMQTNQNIRALELATVHALLQHSKKK